MSTRSRIAIKQEDGKYRSIYCHFDGYPEGLSAHYTDPAKVEELINLGDISSLGQEIGEKHDFDSRVDEWCNVYGRDRGEDCTEAIVSNSLNELIAANRDSGGEYLYIFADGKWEHSPKDSD